MHLFRRRLRSSTHIFRIFVYLSPLSYESAIRYASSVVFVARHSWFWASLFVIFTFTMNTSLSILDSSVPNEQRADNPLRMKWNCSKDSPIHSFLSFLNSPSIASSTLGYLVVVRSKYGLLLWNLSCPFSPRHRYKFDKTSVLIPVVVSHPPPVLCPRFAPP